MKTNQEFKNEALAALRGNWTPAVLVTVVFFALTSLFVAPSIYQSFKIQAAMAQVTPGDVAALLEASSGRSGATALQLLGEIFLIFPLSIGLSNAFLLLLERGDNHLTTNTFHIAFTQYWHKVWGYVLMCIFIFLWSLLLLIPGIVKSFAYAMTPYILEEQPELSANEAINLSNAMMKGHKFDLFYLYLGFLGWGILAVCTFGIGFFWLTPYMQTATAAFYREVKAEFGDGFDAQIKVAAGR